MTADRTRARRSGRAARADRAADSDTILTASGQYWDAISEAARNCILIIRLLELISCREPA